jgi:hypothetical protein
MKHLKMLGIAAIAALGLLVFVGAGTASAATLFTSSNKISPYGAGTTISATLATGTSAALKSGSTTIATCTSSRVHGTTSNETGATVQGNIQELEFSSCSQTTHVLANGSLSIDGEGNVVGVGQRVTLGIFGTSCTYGTGEGVTLGILTGGSPAVLKINALIPRTAGGFLCPSVGTWTAEYVITSPHSLYVGA